LRMSSSECRFRAISSPPVAKPKAYKLLAQF
jgi:hypothetical protein